MGAPFCAQFRVNGYSTLAELVVSHYQSITSLNSEKTLTFRRREGVSHDKVSRCHDFDARLRERGVCCRYADSPTAAPRTVVGKAPIPIIGKLPVVGKAPYGKNPPPPPPVIARG